MQKICTFAEGGRQCKGVEGQLKAGVYAEDALGLFVILSEHSVSLLCRWTSFMVPTTSS